MFRNVVAFFGFETCSIIFMENGIYSYFETNCSGNNRILHNLLHFSMLYEGAS
jgi:hypothetical protein